MSLLLRLKKIEDIINDRIVDKEEVRERIFREGSFERAMGLTEDELEECYQAEIAGERGGAMVKAISINIQKSSDMEEDL